MITLNENTIRQIVEETLKQLVEEKSSIHINPEN